MVVVAGAHAGNQAGVAELTCPNVDVPATWNVPHVLHCPRHLLAYIRNVPAVRVKRRVCGALRRRSIDRDQVLGVRHMRYEKEEVHERRRQGDGPHWLRKRRGKMLRAEVPRVQTRVQTCKQSPKVRQKGSVSFGRHHPAPRAGASVRRAGVAQGDPGCRMRHKSPSRGPARRVGHGGAVHHVAQWSSARDLGAGRWHVVPRPRATR